MATHSSIPAWKIQWTEEQSRLQSIGLQRVRHDSMRTHGVRLSCMQGFWIETKTDLCLFVY